MELLATVDWIISEMNCEVSMAGVRKGLNVWPGGRDASRRKKKLFNDRLLGLAMTRLRELHWTAKD